jgi:hypothetical protein
MSEFDPLVAELGEIATDAAAIIAVVAEAEKKIGQALAKVVGRMDSVQERMAAIAAATDNPDIKALIARTTKMVVDGLRARFCEQFGGAGIQWPQQAVQR